MEEPKDPKSENITSSTEGNNPLGPITPKPMLKYGEIGVIDPEREKKRLRYGVAAPISPESAPEKQNPAPAVENPQEEKKEETKPEEPKKEEIKPEEEKPKDIETFKKFRLEIVGKDLKFANVAYSKNKTAGSKFSSFSKNDVDPFVLHDEGSAGKNTNLVGQRMYYGEYIDRLLKLTATSSTLLVYTNKSMVYEVLISNKKYPNPLDKNFADVKDVYSKVILDELQRIRDRKVTESFTRQDGDNPPIDVLTFTLSYSYTADQYTADYLKADAAEKNQIAERKTAEKFEEYPPEIQKKVNRWKELNKIGKQNLTPAQKAEMDAIQSDIRKYDIDRRERKKKQEEAQQNVTNQTTPSESETKLQQKAIDVGEQTPEGVNKETPSPSESKQNLVQPPQKVETNVNVTVPPTAAPKELPERKAETPTPVVPPPVEKNASVSTNNQIKDKTFIENVSSSVFDKKIVEYERNNTGQPAKPGSITSIPESSVITNSTAKETTNRTETSAGQVSTKETVVPSDLSKMSSSELTNTTSEKTSQTVSNNISNIVKEQVSVIGTTVTTLSDASNTMKTAVETFSNSVKDGASIIQSALNSVKKESSSAVGLTSTAESKTSEKLEGAAVTSENSEKSTSMLPLMQNKVVGLELPAAPGIDISSLSTSIGDSIKNAVTSLVSQNKTLSYPVPVSPEAPKKEANISNSNVENSSEEMANMANQMNQNLSRGGSSMPSVVSLSQSTIDNLASAIIKNMTLTPFLNSGRL